MDGAATSPMSTKTVAVHLMGKAVDGAALDLFADGGIEASQVKHVYGFSRAKAYQMMASGALPFSRIGRKRIIPKRAIAAILASGLVSGTSAAN